MTNSVPATKDGDGTPVSAAGTSARKSSARGSAKSASSRRRNRPGPRQRLLESATQLFTTEGIRVIGIDRILRDADVAKASLYSLFGSKDNLVVAYIEELDQDWRRRWEEMCA
ncbi:TetR/AcrR family transcriptional regulator, partial [uncultured Corynebacterium sp.]